MQVIEPVAGSCTSTGDVQPSSHNHTGMVTPGGGLTRIRRRKERMRGKERGSLLEVQCCYLGVGQVPVVSNSVQLKDSEVK